MSDEVANHLIDVCGDVVKYLLGPIVVALAAGATVWWRSRVTAQTVSDTADTLAKKVDDTANVLAHKTEVTNAQTVKAVAAKTDEQTKVLNQRNDAQDDKLAAIKDQTNGLTAALVKDAGAIGFAAGVKSEDGQANMNLFQMLRKLIVLLERLLALLEDQGKPVKGVVLLLECPTTWEYFLMAKSKKGLVAVPNFTMAELASKGALIQLFDAGDNPTPLPTTPYTTTWTTADPTVLTVAPNATDPSQATVASLGKIGTAVPVTCIVHATDTPPSFADLDCACTVTVPAGPPTQGVIAIAP